MLDLVTTARELDPELMIWEPKTMGLKLVAVGTVLGLAGAALVAPALSGVLFGVQARDVLAFTAVPSILALVAGLAAFIPAVRASRIDPVRALRTE